MRERALSDGLFRPVNLALPQFSLIRSISQQALAMAEDEKAVSASGVAEVPSANSSRPSVVEDNIKDVISVRKPSRESASSPPSNHPQASVAQSSNAGTVELCGTGMMDREHGGGNKKENRPWTKDAVHSFHLACSSISPSSPPKDASLHLLSPRLSPLPSLLRHLELHCISALTLWAHLCPSPFAGALFL